MELKPVGSGDLFGIFILVGMVCTEVLTVGLADAEKRCRLDSVGLGSISSDASSHSS